MTKMQRWSRESIQWAAMWSLAMLGLEIIMCSQRPQARAGRYNMLAAMGAVTELREVQR